MHPQLFRTYIYPIVSNNFFFITPYSIYLYIYLIIYNIYILYIYIKKIKTIFIIVRNVRKRKSGNKK